MARNATGPRQAATRRTFIYQGTDHRGLPVRGEISDQSAALVRARLRRQGIRPGKVVRKRGGGKRKVRPADVALFTRQLATLVKAGVPLVQAFGIVADGLDNPAMAGVVLDLQARIEGGDDVAGALRHHPRLFDALFCNLVAAGEASGTLDAMLERIACYKEKNEALKRKLKKAAKYPLAVIAIATIVVTLLLLKVVPVFQGLFQSFGADLPAFTRLVIGLSEGLAHHLPAIVAWVAAAIAGLLKAHRHSPAFRDGLERLLLRLPVIGPIVRMAAIARFTRTLATTFAAGVPLIEALHACIGGAGNVVYREALSGIRDGVATGQQLQSAMRSSGVFPAMALQMTAIGEESGTLAEMLEKVASHYEDQVDNLVEGLTSLLEPVIMAVLGVLIGALIIAMYLPIFQLGNAV